MMDKLNTEPPYPVEAFEILLRLEESHWWFRSRNILLVYILRTKVSGIKNYLEVGCGTGNVLKAINTAFPRWRLEASEYYSEGLSIAKKRVANCVFRRSDATAMSESNMYDCIGSFDVLEHIPADVMAL